MARDTNVPAGLIQPDDSRSRAHSEFSWLIFRVFPYAYDPRLELSSGHCAGRPGLLMEKRAAGQANGRAQRNGTKEKACHM